MANSAESHLPFLHSQRLHESFLFGAGAWQPHGPDSLIVKWYDGSSHVSAGVQLGR